MIIGLTEAIISEQLLVALSMSVLRELKLV